MLKNEDCATGKTVADDVLFEVLGHPGRRAATEQRKEGVAYTNFATFACALFVFWPVPNGCKEHDHLVVDVFAT